MCRGEVLSIGETRGAGLAGGSSQGVEVGCGKRKGGDGGLDGGDGFVQGGSREMRGEVEEGKGGCRVERAVEVEEFVVDGAIDVGGGDAVRGGEALVHVAVREERGELLVAFRGHSGAGSKGSAVWVEGPKEAGHDKKLGVVAVTC